VRGTLDFDPEAKDYGPASPQIRQVIRDYADVDWFEPGGDLDGAARAFREHESVAGIPHAEPALTEGTRDDFANLCAMVRGNPKWDWRMTVLKQLSHQHTRAHGWRLDNQAPNNLFIRFGNTMLWSFSGPRLELDFDGHWYRGYASADMLDAIQWWLAEPTATANPFVPLVRCYRLGVYPFSLSRDKVVLFAFRYTGQRLPTARLVR